MSHQYDRPIAGIAYGDAGLIPDDRSGDYGRGDRLRSNRGRAEYGRGDRGGVQYGRGEYCRGDRGRAQYGRGDRGRGGDYGRGDRGRGGDYGRGDRWRGRGTYARGDRGGRGDHIRAGYYGRGDRNRGVRGHAGSVDVATDSQSSSAVRNEEQESLEIHFILSSGPLITELQEILSNLEQMPRGSAEIGNILRDKFQNWHQHNLNPFSIALSLVEKTADYIRRKNTSQKRLKMTLPTKTKVLSARILVELGVWLNDLTEKESVWDKWMFEALQVRAFLVSTAIDNMRLLPTTVDVFKLGTIGDVVLKKNIMALIDSRARRYKIAVLASVLLDLQSEFSLSSLLIPCLLQSGGTVGRLFLDNVPPQVHNQLISTLDHLLADREARIPYVQLFQQKQERQLNDLIKRFRKHYKVPLDNCPFFSFEQAKNALYYVIAARYPFRSQVETNPMIDGVWNDQVNILLDKRPDLISFFLENLCKVSRDYAEALKWAKLKSIPTSQWPFHLQRAVNSANLPLAKTVPSPVSSEYAQLPLEVAQNISVVDNMEKLVDFFSHLKFHSSKDGQKSFVGLDSEWQPAFIAADTQSTAIIQVAFVDKVYLLDLISMEKFLKEKEWISLFEKLLCGNDLIKIGFDFDADDKLNLCARVPIFEKIKDNINVVCLQKLTIQLYNQNADLMPGFAKTKDKTLTADMESETESDSEEKSEEIKNGPPRLGRFGLAVLYQYCIDKPLDKTEQRSDWERRPLREAQINYASMDAYCQLEIIDWLRSKSDQLGIDFELALSSVQNE